MALWKQQWSSFAKNSHSWEENFARITTISAHKDTENKVLEWRGNQERVPFSSNRFKPQRILLGSTKPLAGGAVRTGNWNFFRGNPCWRPWANHPRLWRTLHCRVAHAFNHVYVRVSLGVEKKRKRKRIHHSFAVGVIIILFDFTR